MPGLFSLTYVSSATELLSPEEIEGLLDRSREKNQRLGITGLLLYKDGNFMQVIEGEKDQVLGLYEEILSDDRHSGVLTLRQDYIPDRQFSEWTMGFRDLDSDLVKSNPGYDEFLDTPLTGKEFSSNPSRAQSLLLTFKQSM